MFNPITVAPILFTIDRADLTDQRRVPYLPHLENISQGISEMLGVSLLTVSSNVCSPVHQALPFPAPRSQWGSTFLARDG